MTKTTIVSEETDTHDRRPWVLSVIFHILRFLRIRLGEGARLPVRIPSRSTKPMICQSPQPISMMLRMPLVFAKPLEEEDAALGRFCHPAAANACSLVFISPKGRFPIG